MNHPRQRIISAVVAAVLPLAASASSHREAPFITSRPKVDGTDLYMFNSYEAGRSGYVTLIASYQPFEEPQGGPNYYTMDPNALYEISIDNTGSGKEAITFQFRFTQIDKGLSVMAGGKSIPVPLTPWRRKSRIAASTSSARVEVRRPSVAVVTRYLGRSWFRC